MVIFVASFIIIVAAVIGMAVGVLLGRSPIKGSCGGLNQAGLAGSCSGACSASEKTACAQQKLKSKQTHHNKL